MEQFEALKQQITSLEKDATSFFMKGNKAAGTRLRIALQRTKGLSQDIRKDISSRKRSKQ